MPPRSLRLDGTLGDLSELGEVADEITAMGGNFYLYLDPQAALWQEKGYSPRSELALSITYFNVLGYSRNILGYNRNKLNYFLDLEALTTRYNKLSTDLASEQVGGWALDGISSTVYSDFRDEQVLNREVAIEAYRTLLAENDVATTFYQPNDYLFDYMQAYYDMPLGDSGYLYTSETVPFLQIVLSGYIPYYGTGLNFSSDLQADLLRHADYGIYPSYFLSEEATANILNTSSNWIYTSSYGQWGNEIKETYAWLNNLLGPVKGAHIVARQMLGEGIVATSYSNGQHIVVNYTNAPFSVNGSVVAARDAIITEVAP